MNGSEIRIGATEGEEINSDHGLNINFCCFIPETEFNFGFDDLVYNVTQGGHLTDDRLFASNYQSKTSDDYLYVVSGRDGDDELFGGSGNTYLRAG